MSDLREAIAKALYWENPISLYEGRKMAWEQWENAPAAIRESHREIAGAVLAAITAHMAVTDTDAIEMWHALDQAHGIPAHDAMKAALESYVARKLKAETT